MKTTLAYIAWLVLLLLACTMHAQVGVGTTTPEGMLDLQNNNSAGFVIPRVALTATNTASPVVNPNGGGLVAGTVVYNTSSTNTGTNDVSPGIYAWDGSEWNPQFHREDVAYFEQTPLDFRTETGDTSYNSGTSDWAEIPGLESGTTFTPKYTGTYRVKGRFNFAAGKVILPSTGDINMATMEGLFRLTFDGTPHLIYTHSYGVYNAQINGGTYYDNFRHDTTIIFYTNLIAGQAYDFKLEIDIFVATHFENGGDSGDGRGHVGVDIPCSVEFTLID